MSNLTWREAARSVIAPIEREYSDKPLSELKTALRDAYPFGERAYFPYTVWCQEQRLAIARHPAGQAAQTEAATTEGMLC
jgi:hypothetical protein